MSNQTVNMVVDTPRAATELGKWLIDRGFSVETQLEGAGFVRLTGVIEAKQQSNKEHQHEETV